MKSVIKQTVLRNLTLLFIFSLGLLLFFSQPAEAKPRIAPEKINVIMIGDRLVDVSFNLGVLPEAMSVRCSMWPMCKQLLNATQVLGCPKCIVDRIPDIVPDTAKKRGITRIIIEKHPNFCIYKPKVKPANVVPLLKGKGLTIEYVDFSQSLESAIRQTARLLGRESEADALIERYQKALAKAKSWLPKAGLGKKVVVINGTYQSSTGKSFLRIESAGGYSDQYLLEPLGCVNVGDLLKPPTKKKVNKGHFMVRKMDGLVKAKPDVIIITGDTFAVQKALYGAMRRNPALAQVPAIKNLAIYSLPFYGDSSVIEYPAILRQWTNALSN
ncbi:MAG: ABC transporter substrate-binding protein [Thermodesulfobacteriota bacterium]|nr:ABC transporter substrate-binding protein [Thermodesulfobacteriota bacterium]